jgi:REP element-mobilizing transposase RayT
LRNPNINYERGWFFIAVQVAHNKSVFGAVVGEKCELNELGRAVRDAWFSHPEHTPGLRIDEFVVMPNHFHAIVAIGAAARETLGAVAEGYDSCAPDPLRSGNLSWVVGKFKSYTTHLYHKFKEAGKCVDIGTRLWQESFYDNLITSREELERVRQYIKDNPKNWNNDRFGVVTTYGVGNAELLSSKLVAFVASETPTAVGRGHDKPSPRWVGDCENGAVEGKGLREWGRSNIVDLGHCAEGAADRSKCPVISTFTSPEERAVRTRCLRNKRSFIWVCPGGIWDPLPNGIARACEEGWAFVCSPVPSRTGVNKQRAIWCNQYVIKQAESVWVGSIRPGGSLETLLKTIKGECLCLVH